MQMHRGRGRKLRVDFDGLTQTFLFRVVAWLVISTLLLAYYPSRALAAPPLHAALSVGDFTLVNSIRVSRTVFRFTYKARLTNRSSTNLPGVTATATSRNPNLTVIDPTLTFGVVPAGAGMHSQPAIPSQDTFTIEQDRSHPFNPNSLHWLFNVHPQANAGADRTTQVNQTVQLDGSTSSDIGGDELTFRWTLLSKPAQSTAALSSTTAVQPTFTVDKAGTYEVQLVVHDGASFSAPAVVVISTEDSPPLVDELTFYSNPSTPLFFGVKLDDGTAATFAGRKDEEGLPLDLNGVLLDLPDGTKSNMHLDEQGRPMLIFLPDESKIQFVWKTDQTADATLTTGDGAAQVTIAIDLANPSPQGDATALQALRNAMTPEVKAIMEAALAAEPGVIPARSGDILVSVTRDGKPVSGANVGGFVAPSHLTLGYPVFFIETFPGIYEGHFTNTESLLPIAKLEAGCNSLVDTVAQACKVINANPGAPLPDIKNVATLMIGGGCVQFGLLILPVNPAGSVIFTATCEASFTAALATCAVATNVDRFKACSTLANLYDSFDPSDIRFTVSASHLGQTATAEKFAPGTSEVVTFHLELPSLVECGNGIVEVLEGCDDGNTVNGDGCSATCQKEPPRCGNGQVEVGEQCDDGNTVSGDGCRPNCTIERCGDGIKDLLEQCDDGNTVSGDGCRANCTREICGDTITDSPREQCDDGNTVSGDGCRANCTREICGDTITDSPWEECDDGNTVDGDGCRANCKIPRCGDGITDANEQCDDGNTVSGDGCSAQCRACEQGPVKLLSTSCTILESHQNYAVAQLSATGESCGPVSSITSVSFSFTLEPPFITSCSSWAPFNPVPDQQACRRGANDPYRTTWTSSAKVVVFDHRGPWITSAVQYPNSSPFYAFDLDNCPDVVTTPQP